jgi:uncharacterized protein (UPF0276 family)
MEKKIYNLLVILTRTPKEIDKTINKINEDKNFIISEKNKSFINHLKIKYKKSKKEDLLDKIFREKRGESEEDQINDLKRFIEEGIKNKNLKFSIDILENDLGILKKIEKTQNIFLINSRKKRQVFFYLKIQR